ncbi:hypothetical protein WJX79_001075 [Trebouxia sp. C0005]
MGTQQEGIFLPGLARAFEGVDTRGDLSTLQFAKACEAILPVFDRLGQAFAFAKKDMVVKRESLEQASSRLPTLNAVVAADKKAGTVTTKNSCSRNLHRLLSSISFISSLLQNLAADKACTLHTATASAYSSTMAPMHNFFVRTAVKGGMYTLPTRAGFLQSIGETEESARVHSAKFISASNTIVQKAETLFAGTSMPKSDTTWTG